MIFFFFVCIFFFRFACATAANPVENHAWRNAGNSYVQFDAGLVTRLGERAFTIEAWIYNENPTAAVAQPIIAHAPVDCPDIFHVDYIAADERQQRSSLTFLMGAGRRHVRLPAAWASVLAVQQVDARRRHRCRQDAGGDPTSARMYVNGELDAQSDTWQRRRGCRAR
jgi:hypothetical protein